MASQTHVCSENNDARSGKEQEEEKEEKEEEEEEEEEKKEWEEEEDHFPQGKCSCRIPQGGS